MNILAIDLGLKTGWATCSQAEYNSGVWNLKGETDPETFWKLKRNLDAVIDPWVSMRQTVQIAYENVTFRHKSTRAAAIYHALRGILLAQRPGVDVVGIAPAEIKKYATGHGRAGKDLMIEAAVQILKAQSSSPFAGGMPISVADDNQADAVCLLDYMIRVHNRYVEL